MPYIFYKLSRIKAKQLPGSRAFTGQKNVYRIEYDDDRNKPHLSTLTHSVCMFLSKTRWLFFTCWVYTYWKSPQNNNKSYYVVDFVATHSRPETISLIALLIKLNVRHTMQIMRQNQASKRSNILLLATRIRKHINCKKGEKRAKLMYTACASFDYFVVQTISINTMQSLCRLLLVFVTFFNVHIIFIE